MKISLRVKDNIRKYFSFSLQEKAGIVVLVALIIAVAVLKAFIPEIIANNENVDTAKLNRMVSHIYSIVDTTPHKPKEWKKFNSYPSNSDSFRRDSFPKYSHSKWDGKKDTPYKSKYPPKEYQPFKSKYEKKPKVIVELNTVDSATLASVSYVGDWTAGKIVKLRNRYRGFYSIWQLLEIWKMDSARIEKFSPYITVNPGLIRKFDLNTLEKDSVKGHFYFNFKMVGIMKRYREQHGPYKSVDDIKKTGVIPDSTFNKIAPYLMVK